MLRLLLTGLLMATLPFVLSAQEANDDCANAVEILVDLAVPFSTIDATNVGPVVTGCGGFTPAENDSIPADIWFIWTAVESGTYSWSNCGTGVFDSRMAVYNGTDACAITNDDLVNCNDDGTGCTNAESDVIFLATAGETYVLRLGGFADADTAPTMGEGTVELTQLNVPANDACTNAVAITLGADQQFTNVNATTDGPSHDGSNPCFQFADLTINGDVWYTYTPDFSGTVEWTTCDDINFDSRMAVYQPGASCPPLPEDLYGCNDDGVDCTAGTFHSQMFFEVEAGETYLLRIGGFVQGGVGVGTFDLINNSPPEPPANDDCANATETMIITPAEADDFDFAEVGTTLNATFNSDDFRNPSCNPFNPGGLWGDVWYTVETQGNDSIQMRLFSDGEQQATDFFIEAFASCTDTLASPVAGTCLLVDAADNLGARSTITGLPSGENITILIRVATRLTTQAPGGFGFQLVGDISTSTREELQVEDLKLYPNPANEQITVSMNLPEGTVLEAQVFDLLGRNVLSRDLGNLPGGHQQFTLNTSDLTAGIYSLRLTDGRASQSLKFVKN
jgi:hypothetical protein